MNDFPACGNELGLPVGPPVSGWTGASMPPRAAIQGCAARVEPLDPDIHAAELFESFRLDREGRLWTYLPSGPFETEESLREELRRQCARPDRERMPHAIIDLARGTAAGMASYLRANPEAGSIEVGLICMSPLLQRTIPATESMYLMASRVFGELGYRRYEWKCDSLNGGSRRAAVRLGFAFEGVHRQSLVYRGRNRDTAWYAMLDREWPALSKAFEAWLDPSNFDCRGRQRASLSGLVAEARRSLPAGT